MQAQRTFRPLGFPEMTMYGPPVVSLNARRLALEMFLGPPLSLFSDSSGILYLGLELLRCLAQHCQGQLPRGGQMDLSTFLEVLICTLDTTVFCGAGTI